MTPDHMPPDQMTPERPTPDQTASQQTTTQQTTTERVTRQRATVSTPIGELQIIAEDDAIVAILFDCDHPLGAGAAHNPTDGRWDLDAIVIAPETPVLVDAVNQLTEYFAGDRTEFDLPLAAAGTEFQRSAWEALRQIPFGTTVSYGEQASTMGDRRKARAVGAANGKNPIPIVVPCHRVVGADGSLTGFAGGVGVKQWLLAHEQRQGRLV